MTLLDSWRTVDQNGNNRTRCPTFSTPTFLKTCCLHYPKCNAATKSASGYAVSIIGEDSGCFRLGAADFETIQPDQMDRPRKEGVKNHANHSCFKAAPGLCPVAGRKNGCWIKLLHSMCRLAVSQFRVCILWRSIWRPITSKSRAKAVPIWRLLQMLLLSLFREDAPILSFMASHISTFFVRPKKKKEREKMATLHGVDRHFCGPGWQKSWCKGKTPGDANTKCSNG